MNPKRITTTASLVEALDHRSGDASAREAFDRAIWAELGTDAAILVTDLSGFTRLTKTHGILHFLAIFRRCERICMPVIKAHGGCLMKHEADDLICIFPGPLDALHASLDMLRALETANRTLDPDDHVNLCVGIESGHLLRLEDDAFGDPVNVACKLGEDIAKAGEVLLGPNAYAAARASAFDFSGWIVDGPRSVVTGNVPLEHYSIRRAPPLED